MNENPFSSKYLDRVRRLNLQLTSSASVFSQSMYRLQPCTLHQSDLKGSILEKEISVHGTKEKIGKRMKTFIRAQVFMVHSVTYEQNQRQLGEGSGNASYVIFLLKNSVE